MLSHPKVVVNQKNSPVIYPLFCRKRLKRQKSMSAFFAGWKLLFRTFNFNPIRDIPSHCRLRPVSWKAAAWSHRFRRKGQTPPPTLIGKRL